MTPPSDVKYAHIRRPTARGWATHYTRFGTAWRNTHRNGRSIVMVKGTVTLR